MRTYKLKLHKVKVVKLTHTTKIFGGSENSETTYTTTGNDDSNTQATTSTATSNNMTYCNSYEEDCPSNTNDTENNNNSVPTFNQSIQPGP